MTVFNLNPAPMQDDSKKLTVLSQLKNAQSAINLPELSTLLENSIPERTLRRWLVKWVENGVLERTGQKRGTRYQYNAKNWTDIIKTPQPSRLQAP